jgi:protein-tyrosine phosphatase
MDIRDPFGGSVEIYRKCADELEQEIRKILKKWRNES